MLRIKVFSDYICPFCYIGGEIIKSLENEYDFQVEWIGMEIHPETPSEGVNLNQRFGKERLEASLGYLRSIAEAHHLPFNPSDHMPNSHMALEAAEYAREEGNHDAFHKALMDAYFVKQNDISDLSVLKGVASQVGLDVDAMTEAVLNRKYEEKLKNDLKDAYHYGISSTPTFVINDAYMITGAQPIENFRNAFNQIIEQMV